MMNKLKKFTALILCLLVCMFMCPALSAAEPPKIIISSATGLPGDTVSVDVSITNNPGIMAMTFSITYDNKNLEFVECSKGFMSSPVYKDHSDKGYVAFSISESSDKVNSGVIMSLTFKIKDNAAPGKHTINLANHKYEKNGNDLSNCFSNSKQELFVPTVKAGDITVEETCNNAGHKFGGWLVTKPANCTETGIKKHTCARCGTVEEEKIPITHDFEADWTVDEVATPQKDGVMSRHCKKCDAVTDKIKFSYEEIGGGDDNSSNEESTDSSSSEDSSEDSSSESSSSSEFSSGGTSSSNTSTENNSSDNTQTSSDNSLENSGTKKPVINNTEGAKNPLSEVEKLENYQEILKPEKEENSSSSKVTSSASTPASLEKNDTITTGSSDTTSKDDNNSSSATASNIIIAIICALLSAGIIALGVLLIIRKRKEENN